MEDKLQEIRDTIQGALDAVIKAYMLMEKANVNKIIKEPTLIIMSKLSEIKIKLI